MDSQTVLFISLVGSFGVPTIAIAVYKIFFHKDTEPHRKEINELKEKHQDEKIERLENDLLELKKKHSQKAEDTHKKHQEFELKFLEMSTKMIGIEATIKNIDSKIDKVLEYSKLSKII